MILTPTQTQTTDTRRIHIRPGDRAVFIGQTGTGKTYAAGRFVQSIPQSLLVIDIKGMWDLPNPECRNFAYAENVEQVNRESLKNDVVIYRPGLDQDVTDDTNAMLRACYERKSCCVYFDDIYGLSADGKTWPDSLNPVYTRGRQLGLTMVSCVQRPTRVPLFVITECEHVFDFDLNLYDDRTRMAGIMGNHVRTNPSDIAGSPYHFWYYNSRWPSNKQIMVPCKINSAPNNEL